MLQQSLSPPQLSDSSIRPNTFRFRNPRNKKYILHKMISKQQRQLLQKLKKRQKKKDPQYFSKMLKQQKKKMFVNTFIRKLKNSITLKQSPVDYTFSTTNGQNQYLQSFQIPKYMEIFISTFLFIQILPLLVINSLALVFDQISQSNFLKVYNIISLFIHIFQMVIKFFIKHQYQQKKKKYLRQNIFSYLHSQQFLIDIATLLSFILWPFFHYSNPQSQIVILCQLGILFKIKTLIMILSHLELVLIQNQYRQEIWNLIKVFLFNFVIAHCLTIFLVGMTRFNDEKNWIIQKGLQTSEWNEVYIWSYYWATTIMLTVGFGDICPTNKTEAFCMIFIETMSCIVLAYNINRVGSIISKIRSYDLQRNNNLKVFNQISQKSQINTEIQDKITNYIKQSTVIKRNYNIQEQKTFISKLPLSFKDELLKQMNKKIWNGMTFFQNLSQKTLLQLSKRIEKKLTHPQQIVYTRGHQIDVMIFNNGTFGLTYNFGNARSNGTIMQSIQVNQNQFRIASLDFLLKQTMNYDIKCVDYMILYKLSLSQFLSTLQNYSYDYQYLCTVKDKDKFLLNQFEIQKCKICSNQRHTLFKCPRLHYIPLKQHIVDKYKKQMKKRQLDLLKTKIRIRQKITDLDALKQRKTIKDELMKKRLQISANRDDSFGTVTQITNLRTQTCLKGLNQDISDQLIPQTLQWANNQQKTYFQIAVDKIKQDLNNNFKQNSKQNRTTVWEIECDVAHNYKFYFKQSNSQELGKKPHGRKSKAKFSFAC